MQRYWHTLCLGLIVGAAAGAAVAQGPDPTAEQRQGTAARPTAQELRAQAAEYLAVVSQGENLPAADGLLGLMAGERLSDAGWVDIAAAYFGNNPFTPGHARFLGYALDAGAGTRVAIRAGILTGQAIGQSLARLRATGAPAALASAQTAVAWLGDMRGYFGPSVPQGVLAALGDGIAPAQFPLPAPGAGGVPGVDVRRLGAQLCLTFGRYAAPGSEAYAAALRLPPLAASFIGRTGVLLFDNAALSAAQVDRLAQLVSLIPGDLHTISALVVGEAMGFGAGNHGLASPGQLVFIAAVPLGARTHPKEFQSLDAPPLGNDFVVAAARDIADAIQAVQYQRRPYLARRRDAILAWAGNVETRYLRNTRFVAPQAYLSNPGRLVPSLAIPYFISSGALFHQATFHLELGLTEPLDQFLLMADVMSGGGDRAPVFRVAPDGGVQRDWVLIGRTRVGEIELPGDMPFSRTVRGDFLVVNRIRINGVTWNFELDQRGSVVRWTRD